MTSDDLKQPIRHPALELTREQILDLLERGAQVRLHLSARGFLRAYREGHLEDPGAVGDLVVLADLLSEDDPLFKAA
jgi:hypothetical protein